jgi:glycosidase
MKLTHIQKHAKHSLLLTLAITSALFVGACSKPQESAEVPAPEAEVKAPSISSNKTDYLTRNIQDEVFYFVMPDRFHNAKSENDMGDPSRPISYGGYDPTKIRSFHGGDIAGLEAKLDYIDSLGITSIWMTPILRNKAIQQDGIAHHGYWVVDFTEIDPHFGSNDDLKSLIEAAHERDIKVFFDIITNHTADVIKYEECHDQTGKFKNTEKNGCAFISSEELQAGKRYTPFVLENEKQAKVPAWLNDPKYYNNQGDSFWEGESAVKGDFVGLDDIDTSQAEVISGLTEVFKDLISDFRPDGFRIDTVKHVDIEFWQSFGPDIIEHAQSIGLPEFFIFGEVYDGNPAGLSKFTTKGKLPSVLDFSFAFNTNDVVFNNKSLTQLSNLFDNDDYYRDADSTPNDLLNFLGNHDMGRVGHFIQKGASEASASEQLALAKIAHAFMYFSRGVPVVYYGDEQGFTGDGGDVDARENMDPSKVDSYNDNTLLGTNKTTADDNFDQSHPLYIELAKLSSLRSEHQSLRRGEHINRLVDDEKRIYAFSRIQTMDMIDHMVVLNLSNETQQTTLRAGMSEYSKIAGIEENTVELSGDQLMLSLAPYSYTIVKSKDAITKSMVSGISMLPPYTENDRLFLSFELEFSNPEQFNFANIDVFGIAENGEKTKIAFDTTAPYRAVIMPELVSQFTQVEVVSDNFQGQSKRAVFDISIP